MTISSPRRSRNGARILQTAAVVYAVLFLGLWVPIWIGFEGWGFAYPLFFLATLVPTALFIIGAVSAFRSKASRSSGIGLGITGILAAVFAYPVLLAGVVFTGN